MRRSRAPAVALSIAIQHHPSRGELLRPLLSSLNPFPPFVAFDPDPEGRPNPLRTYVRALEYLPAWATHHLVLQDDALPCENFVAAAGSAIAARPANPIAFFLSEQSQEYHRAARAALDDGDTFATLPLRRWAPVVALCWPRDLVAPFLEHAAEIRGARADDDAVGGFLRSAGAEVLATVPSLVEHPDSAPSVVGRRTRGGRRAAFYVGERDALAIPWR